MLCNYSSYMFILLLGLMVHNKNCLNLVIELINYPLTYPIGVALTILREIPARSVLSTTSLTIFSIG